VAVSVVRGTVVAPDSRMQPPLPRKPEPRLSLGAASQQGPAPPGRHPLSPADVSLDQHAASAAHLIGTNDPALVRAWAGHHDAEPATGEASPSGPATVHVNDQGTGLRFNFPGMSRYRPVPWDEWLAHFMREQLIFVYEAQHDGDTALSHFGGAFYRLVRASEWGDQLLATLVP
jgi:hypothetical protein